MRVPIRMPGEHVRIEVIPGPHHFLWDSQTQDTTTSSSWCSELCLEPSAHLIVVREPRAGEHHWTAESEPVASVHLSDESVAPKQSEPLGDPVRIPRADRLLDCPSEVVEGERVAGIAEVDDRLKGVGSTVESLEGRPQKRSHARSKLGILPR